MMVGSYPPPPIVLLHSFGLVLNMPKCGNCEEFVIEQYIQVSAPTVFDTVRVHPNYEAKHCEGIEIRKTHSSQQVYG